MKKTNIKTFRALLEKDLMGINELAQLVKLNGTLYINSWGAWEASLPGNAETKDAIDAALNVLSDCASAFNTCDMTYMDEYYDSLTHHPLDNFGFTIGENNKLFVEKTAVQNPQELISQLQSELTSAKQSAKTKASRGRWAERDKHIEEVQKIAKKLWDEDDTRTIAYIINHDETNKIKKSDGTNYSEGVLRSWINDFAPSNKPGRPKEN
jgi:hypothetical protein